MSFFHLRIMSTCILLVACDSLLDDSGNKEIDNILPDISGTWTLKGQGELLNCTDPGYNTDKFELKTVAFTVEQGDDNELTADNEKFTSGTYFPTQGKVDFVIEENSGIGALRFKAEQWNVDGIGDQAFIRGEFKIEGSCQGTASVTGEIILTNTVAEVEDTG